MVTNFPIRKLEEMIAAAERDLAIVTDEFHARQKAEQAFNEAEQMLSLATDPTITKEEREEFEAAYETARLARREAIDAHERAGGTTRYRELKERLRKMRTELQVKTKREERAQAPLTNRAFAGLNLVFKPAEAIAAK